METLKLLLSLLMLLVGLSTAAAIAYDYNGQSSQAEAKSSFLISFPDGAPAAVVSDVMNKLENLGASITHEYSTITAFAIEAPQSVVNYFKENVQPQVAAGWKPTIEADRLVSAFDGNGPV
ncbi:hypothetical protein ABW21_db0209723 [Orbilia brochopaga]|nr:hypothetical protein ABW21_db0209723 [Drechslerella brochopaga]